MSQPSRILKVFEYCVAELNTDSGAELNRLMGKLDITGVRSTKNRARHIIFIARNPLGLYNLYRLVSESNVHYFMFRPRLPRSLIRYFRAGITVGSACEAGEVFRAILQQYMDEDCDYERCRARLAESHAMRIADFYDYLEIQPLG
ncbi:MAG: PHP domain-containing protein, partial [Eubacteriales bacterium]|nr:PHP domain-containing protein [Eubacteriales bacterium]